MVMMEAMTVMMHPMMDVQPNVRSNVGMGRSMGTKSAMTAMM